MNQHDTPSQQTIDEGFREMEAAEAQAGIPLIVSPDQFRSLVQHIIKVWQRDDPADVRRYLQGAKALKDTFVGNPTGRTGDNGHILGVVPGYVSVNLTRIYGNNWHGQIRGARDIVFDELSVGRVARWERSQTNGRIGMSDADTKMAHR